MRILQLGAGLMGRAIAYDLLRNAAIERLTVVDQEARRLKETEQLINNVHELRLFPKKLDLSDIDKIKELMQESDTVISAVPYMHNYELARLAVQYGCNFCDLGGNNTIVQKQLQLHDRARKKDVTLIPDCGLAPGMVSILVADGMKYFDDVLSVRIRVGGLPVHPTPPLNYMQVFSIHGLINEYTEPCMVIRDGRIAEAAPLEEVEAIEFPEPFGTLEAFNTSGGTSTLPQTYFGKIRNLDYKTIRYPGHCAQFKLLADLGLMDTRPVKAGDARLSPREFMTQMLSNLLPADGRDCVLVRVTMEGLKNGLPKFRRYQIIDFGEPASGITAMMRLTAFPASIIAQMLASGQIEQKGARPQEVSVPPHDFLWELQRRGIEIQITET